MELTDFLHVDTDSQKLKADKKYIGWAWSRMGGVPVWLWDPKIDSTQKWADGINCFFACWVFVWAWSKMAFGLLVHENLKSDVF